MRLREATQDTQVYHRGSLETFTFGSEVRVSWRLLPSSPRVEERGWYDRRYLIRFGNSAMNCR